jgi:hypothetical protein
VEVQQNRPHPHFRQTKLNHCKERRANTARRSSRFFYPKTAARKLHQTRLQKNQPPQNRHHWARFDWGVGAVCFGASPVAAVFGSAPGSATSPEHRYHLNPTLQTQPLKADISIWQRSGHFYLALTSARLLCRPFGIVLATEEQF